jgi:hypothetical protein
LHRLMSDLSSPSNHLEGSLSGNLEITHATVGQWRSVGGYGHASLRDGLIWEIPLFGRFSPILDGIAPGMGSSRVSAANAKFEINKGVIRTEDLEMRAGAMRLDYHGTVNLQQQVDAKVEAKLLRDVWVVGPLISNILLPLTTLFEYRVSGTLSEPKTEPLYLWPKIILAPFHPIRTFKNLMPEEKTQPATNAPPAGVQQP